MQCPTCGTEIQPGVTRCPSCGTPTTPTPLQTSGTLEYDPAVETIPYVEYSPLTKTSVASPASPASSTTPSSPSFSPEPGPDAIPQQQSVQQKRAERPPILRSTAVLLIILAGLIVVGGSGVTAYATFFHAVEFHAQATAVTQSILTQQAQATAAARANSPQRTYDRITNILPSFTDPLDGRHSSPWSNQSKGGTGCAFSNGAYHVRIAPNDFYSYCLATGSHYSNFLYEVQMTIVQGLDGGVVFRTSNPSLPSYVFTITYSGFYALNVSLDPQHGRTLVFGRSLAIKTGLNQANLLGVLARAGNISLFINKHFVASASDDTYSSGAIGLVTSNFPQTSIDVAFNNVRVWNLP